MSSPSSLPEDLLSRSWRSGEQIHELLATYVSARAVLGLSLVVMQVLPWFVLRRGEPGASLLVCSAYAAQALGVWLWPKVRTLVRGRIDMRQWWLTIGADVLVFSALHALDNNSSFNFAALLVLPVLMAGVLCTWLPALATSAAVTLVMLGVALDRAAQGGDVAGLLMQSGLAGGGLFIITLVAGQLANWAASEERTAFHSLAMARQQAELNRLVIDEMAEGILVVDAHASVRVANPAARALLAEGGGSLETPFSLLERPGWWMLWRDVERAFSSGHWPPVGTDLTLTYERQPPCAIRMRIRCTQRPTPSNVSGTTPADPQGLAVVFLEEASSVEARQRQERLMTMGRMAASVAHEIRNPLAAIAQANELFMEDDLRPDQQLLGRIVADNVERLKRIVDDVLEAAPAGSVASSVLDLVAETQAIVQEWSRTTGDARSADGLLKLDWPPGPLGVFFDAHHLRRVVVNLLDNARRHTAAAPGAVWLGVSDMEAGHVRLWVGSRGEPIAPDVERYLFEPFHSTRSRGTGLGLYICRELCQRHGAMIDYQHRPDTSHPNVFSVVMRRASATF
jgi:two-component system, NtrC family, sensor histidine kinase PilS